MKKTEKTTIIIPMYVNRLGRSPRKITDNKIPEIGIRNLNPEALIISIYCNDLLKRINGTAVPKIARAVNNIMLFILKRETKSRPLFSRKSAHKKRIIDVENMVINVGIIPSYFNTYFFMRIL